MIRLTDEQVNALAEEQHPPRVVNPRTQETFVLLRQDVYERVRQIVAEANEGADWNDPAFDVYDRDEP